MLWFALEWRDSLLKWGWYVILTLGYNYMLSSSSSSFSRGEPSHHQRSNEKCRLKTKAVSWNCKNNTRSTLLHSSSINFSPFQQQTDTRKTDKRALTPRSNFCQFCCFEIGSPSSQPLNSSETSVQKSRQVVVLVNGRHSQMPQMFYWR